MKLTRIAALLLTLTLCLLSAACSPEAILSLTDRAQDPVSKAVQTVSVAAAPGTEPVFAPSGDQKADKAVRALVEAAVERTRNRDKAGFAKLFVDADEATVDLWWNNFCTAVDYCGGGEHVDATIVSKTEGYYVVGFCLYTVTGVSPNARVYHYFGAMIARYENGKAVFTDQSDEIYRKVRPGMEDALFDALGEEGASARAAMESGRNFSAFSYNWLFLDPDFSFLNYYDTPEPLYIWQEENGDVKVMMWSANGLDRSMSSYNTTLTITDQQHGTVFDGQIDVTIPLLPHRNGFRVVTIPADEIQTGALPWTSLWQSNRSHY